MSDPQQIEDQDFTRVDRRSAQKARRGSCTGSVFRYGWWIFRQPRSAAKSTCSTTNAKVCAVCESPPSSDAVDPHAGSTGTPSTREKGISANPATGEK